MKKEQAELIQRLENLSIELGQALSGSGRREKTVFHRSVQSSTLLRSADTQEESVAYREAIEKIIAQLNELKEKTPVYGKIKNTFVELLTKKGVPDTEEALRQTHLLIENTTQLGRQKRKLQKGPSPEVSETPPQKQQRKELLSSAETSLSPEIKKRQREEDQEPSGIAQKRQREAIASPVQPEGPSELAPHLLREASFMQNKGLVEKKYPKSLLSQPAPTITAKQLGHIHGDAFLEDSGLEGLPTQASLLLMRNMIRMYQSAYGAGETALSQVGSLLENAIVVERSPSPADLHNEIQREIHSLQEGQSALVAGGWFGNITHSDPESAGHALYYEITRTGTNKTGDSLFSVSIFNTGAGLQYHSKHVENSQKKYIPILSRTGVSEASLLGETFINGLWTICQDVAMDMSARTTPIHYTAADVYKGLMSTLDGRQKSPISIDPATADVDRYIIPQQSGTCTWTGLMAFVRTKLNKPDFLRFQYYVGWQSLVGFFNAYKTSFTNEESEKDRRLLFLCTEKFARDCINAHALGAISEEEFEKALATAQEIKDSLHYTERAIFLRRYSAIPDLDIARQQESLPLMKVPLLSSQEVSAEKMTFDIHRIGEEQFWDFSKPLEASTLTSVLETLYQRCLALQPDRPTIAIALIEKMLDQLPIPMKEGDLWSHIPQEDICTCMEQITKLTELRLRLCVQLDYTQEISDRSETVFEAFKAMAIQHRLLQLSGVIPDFDRYVFDASYFKNVFRQIDSVDSTRQQKKQITLSCLLNPRHNDQLLKLFDYFSTEEEPKATIEFEGAKPLISFRTAWPDLCCSFMQNNPTLTDLLSPEERKEDPTPLLLSNPERFSNPPNPFVLWYRQALVAGYLAEVYPNKLSSAIVRDTACPFKFYIQKQRGLWRIAPLEVLDSGEWKISMTSGLDVPLQKVVSFYDSRTESDWFDQEFIMSRKWKDTIQGPLGTFPHSDELQDLFVLFTVESNELRLSKLLSFFIQHPQLIKELPYQEFFALYVASPCLLSKSFSTSADLLKRFRIFVSRGLEEATLENDIPKRLFYTRIAQQMLETLQLLHMATPEDEALVPSPKEIVEKATSDFEKALAYRELAGRIVRQESPLGQDAVLDLIKARAFLACHPIPSLYRNSLDDQIERKIIAYALEIARYMKDPANRDVLSSFLNGLGIDKRGEESWDFSSSFLRCQRGTTFIDLLNGFLEADDRHVGPLPLSVIRDPDFTSVFSHGDYPAAISHNGTVFTFTDTKGEARVLLTGNTLRIQRNIGGRWYEFVAQGRVPKGFFDSNNPFLGSVQLVESTSFWVATDTSEILLLDKKTQDPTYKVSLREKTHIESIERVSDGCRLANNFYDKDSPYRFLEAIEDKAYIHIWQKNEKTSHIELPRYDLTLTVEEKQGVTRAFLDHPAGFYIADQQRLRGMGTFGHFLIIENAQGIRKILMPRREVLFDEQTKGAHPLSTQLTMNHRATSTYRETSSFLIYEIDSEGCPESSGREENLYLAYLLLGQKNYSGSMEQIRKYAEDIKAYSPQEEELFLWMKTLATKGNDNNPQACAALLCAAACLLKNCRQFGKKPPIEPQEFIEFLHSRYTQYLQVIGHVTTSKLSEDEENELLRYLRSSDPTLMQRKELLEGRPQPKSTIDIAPEQAPYTRTVDAPIPKISEPFAATSSHNILRPGNRIEQNFLEYYVRAKKKDPSLLPELRLARNDPEVNKNFLGLLECISQAPDLFPQTDAVNRIIIDGKSSSYEIRRKALDEWKEQVVAIARKVASELPQEAPFQTSLMLTLTPSPPRSEIPRIEIHPVPPSKETKVHTAKDVIASFFNVLTKRLFTRFFHPVEAPVPMDVDQETDSLVQSLSPSAGAPHVREWDELQADIRAASLRPPQHYSLHEEDVLQNFLQIEHAEIQKILYRQEAELLRLANVRPSHEAEAVQREMELVSTQRGPVTMRDLTLFFIQQDPAVLLEKNPSLSREQLDTINRDLLTFLVTFTQRQHIERAQKILSELSSSSVTEEQKAILVNELAAELERKRSFSPSQHPEYLVYEASAHILIRKEQVAILEKMEREDAPETIYQMIMGSGKSKVLLPILALKRATGKNLSIIIVPEPLAEAEARDMQISVGQSFYQATTVIHRDRHSDYSAEKMKELYEDLVKIRDRRECLVMTSKTPGCLLLQFETELKEYVKRGGTGPIPENIEWMRKILLLLRESGDAIFDEADVILDSRKELNFSIGEPEALPEERLDCIEILFEAVSETLPQGAEVALDPSNFDANLREEIAQKWLGKVEQRGGAILTCLQRTGLKREHLFLYITGSASHQIEETVARCDEQVRDLLDLMKGELTQLLPLTLGKACDTGYGFSRATSKAIAIPYDSNNSPVEVSDFGSTYEILNYTVQSYLNKRPLPPHIIRPIVARIQNQLQEEKREYPDTRISDLPSYKKLQELMGDEPFHPFDEVLYEHIINQLSDKNHPQRLLKFVRTYVFPQIVIHPEKVSLTAPGLVDIFHHVQGFTGTPWNRATYPSRLTTELATGTDGTTLRLLWEKSKALVHELNGEGFEAAAEEMVALIRGRENCRAFIDTGALFRGSNNETVARYLLNNMPQDCKGVVFYRGDKMMMLERGRVEAIPFEDSDLNPSERFTYYDQRHTTGSDIHQSAQAMALESIGKDLPLRGFAQGAWRMRGLGAEQHIEFVIPPSARKKILEICGGAEVRDVSHIIKMVAEEQYTKLDDHCLLAAVQKADQVLKKRVLDALINGPELDHDRIMAAAPSLDLFVTNTEDHPHLTFGAHEGRITREEFRHTLFDREKQRIDHVWGLPEDRMSVTPSLERTIKESPIQEKGIPSSSSVETAEVETEREKEKETERELEVEMRSEETEPRTGHVCNFLLDNRKFNNQPVDPSEHFGIKKGYHQSLSINALLTRQGIALEKPLFDEEMYASPNFYCTTDAVGDNPLFFTQDQYPVQYFLVTKLEGITKVRFLSFSEAQWFLTGLKRGSKNNLLIFLYDMNVGLIQHAGDEKEISEILESDEFSSFKVQAKFFNGECVYSKAEIPHLRRWIQGKDKKALMDFLVNTILLHKPAQRAKVKGSILAKVLTE
jgi:hypothetical protein